MAVKKAFAAEKTPKQFRSVKGHVDHPTSNLLIAYPCHKLNFVVNREKSRGNFVTNSNLPPTANFSNFFFPCRDLSKPNLDGSKRVQI